VNHLPKRVSGSFRQAALYPPYLPAAGYPLYPACSSSRRMGYLPETQTGTL
jgi:hypothetical protein